MKVIVKENDPHAARTLERMLRKLGHTSEWVEHAQDLLCDDTRFDPDIIITDIFMPDVEGLELIRRLKRSALAHVPIIAVSGGGHFMGGIADVENSFVAKAAITFGAARFLRKPVTLMELEAALAACSERGSSAPNVIR
ncbi:MAG: response regulator [Erythrobacter sp.]|jgi:DNA-binding response OmpR family regulator|nr:response regulator [Erythrobacter sp.]